MSAPYKPFETEREARAAAHAVVKPEPGWSILRVGGNRELLCRALEDAGVEMGAYDSKIADWMGQWEDSVVAVIAGWIARAARCWSASGSAGSSMSCTRRSAANSAPVASP